MLSCSEDFKITLENDKKNLVQNIQTTKAETRGSVKRSVNNELLNNKSIFNKYSIIFTFN